MEDTSERLIGKNVKEPRRRPSIGAAMFEPKICAAPTRSLHLPMTTSVSGLFNFECHLLAQSGQG